MFNYGGFQGPEILLDKNVVYVNFNYRLGPLGFLSTEDDVVPGNNGLKDQIVALKFIREHIKHFGGNTNSITLAGNSAGGASVHFHCLIKKSRGQYLGKVAAVVDTWSRDPLLPMHPYELLKKKMVYDIPWLVSHVGSEGLYPAAGAAHGDDASYILNMSLNTQSDENDRKMSDILVNIWLSFAEMGFREPEVCNVNWTQVSKSSKQTDYLKISSPNDLEMEANSNMGHVQFWNSLPINENEKLLQENDW
ncbi:hypothetical protein NQ317_007215 [Molorchus minor]|uniref:Carboxylic ester hydrolase n=1 Tax=Molorchus minor TaxID=1323400 RepID=A0ABQ9IS79_9CUCU|nr:hypothetical protein NQ317_007215 [Molorchus minor]